MVSASCSCATCRATRSPSSSHRRCEVQTEALGLSAEEVEQLITVPLEQDLLNGVAFLDYIRSESVPGLSRIELDVRAGHRRSAGPPGRERAAHAGASPCPNVSTPPQMLQPLLVDEPRDDGRLSSETESLIDLVGARPVDDPARAAWRPGRRQRLGLGSARPAAPGAGRPGSGCSEQGVTLDEVIRTTGNALWVSPLTFLEASTPGTGGFFDTPTQRIGVQHIQPIKTPEDLAKVRSRADDGAAEGTARRQRSATSPTVVEDHQPLIGDAVFTDGPGLLLVVEKLPEANTLEVTDDARQTRSRPLRPGLPGVERRHVVLPSGATTSRPSGDNLRIALHHRPAFCSLLVLRRSSSTCAARVVALFSVLVALAAAVARALDRAARRSTPWCSPGSCSRSCVRDRRRGASRVDVDPARMSTADGDGSVGTLVAVPRRRSLYGTVIALLALVPIFVLDGELGAFLPPLALSYAAAVVASPCWSRSP